MNIYEKIALATQSITPAVIATIIDTKGSTPREIGTKMLVYQNGDIEGTIGGGAIEKVIVEQCLLVLQSQHAQIFEYNLTDLKMECGGFVKVFLEPLIPKIPLNIFGAGHIGLALANMCQYLNYSITVIDNRKEFANKERFPMALKILAVEYNDAFAHLDFSQNTYNVIITHRHLYDEEVLEKCTQQPFAYIGMIGSKTKVNKTINNLKEKGFSQDLINKIYSPIGLNIGAKTPEEIAVAILGEMIGVYNKADLTQLSMKI